MKRLFHSNMARLSLGLVAAFSTSLAQGTTLSDAAVDEVVIVNAFRYAPDRSFVNSLKLRRIDIYAADAKVWVAEPRGLREIPRSDLRLFVGDPDSEAQRLYLAVSADGESFEGAIFDTDGTHAIRGRLEGSELMVEHTERVEDESREFSCHDSRSVPPNSAQGLQHELKDIAKSTPQPAGTATRQALIAVDTDNELMNLKFGNNQTTANNYIAALFTGMNVFYQRDLNVRLQLGTVILRPSTTPDPFASVTDSDIGVQLDEFGEHWRVTPSLAPGVVPRAFSAQLSGKLSNNNQASGIAWILTSGNYCSATGQVFGSSTFGHYSVTRVFKFNGSTAANDVSIVGHELGHNFGAFHTHCSSNQTGGIGSNVNQLIDRCFSGESVSGGVCHSGAVSCPTDNSVSGRGSLMSYCNFSPPSANCGPVLQEFHPAHQTFLGGRITTNFNNGCITAVTGNVGPTLSANSPANNSTTNMGGGTIGAQVTRNITFNVAGGSGTGTTQLTCSVGSGTVAINSGTPQTISVGGSANAVVARFTLSASAQSGVINCSAVPQGGSTSNFTYTFTANAGTPVSTNRIFCSGFEPGQTGVCGT